MQLMGNVANVTAGSFANPPVAAGGLGFRVFGADAGNVVVPHGNSFYQSRINGLKYMSIFGKRTGGAWEIYTQSIDDNNVITDHRRIF